MKLTIPPRFPLPGIPAELSEHDAMFTGQHDHYLAVGLSALRIIEAAYRDDPPPRRILDIPCGHGRVTRVLRARFPEAHITVSDVDRDAVDFCAATFAAHGAYSSDHFTSLDFGAPFDLIWVGSLLTHLPKSQTANFLDFAVRHMHARSRLIVTSHGAYAAEQLRSHNYGLPDDIACSLFVEHRMRGYGFRGYDGNANYGISIIDRRWFEELLAESPIVLQSYQPRGWDRHQDALIFRLRETPGWLWKMWHGRARSFSTVLQSIDPVPSTSSGTHIEGFDEEFYLQSYPDVASAVRRGDLGSGLAHFQAYGWRENRNSCPPLRTFSYKPRVGRSRYLGLTGSHREARVDEIWSQNPEQEAEENGQYWMAHRAVRARVNVLATGNAETDAYDRLAELARAQSMATPIRNAISLGCGFGALERDLITRGLITEIEAYDLAPGAIEQARHKAAELGLTGLRFHVADLERMRLRQKSVDVVIAHSSVHHVERMEALFTTVRRSLRPGGLFHLNEFVGPSRFQWTDRQIELSNHFLASLPDQLRRLPSGKLKENLRRPTIDEMIAADPTEAVRSAEITSLLKHEFDIIETRLLGGALLHLALGGIAQNFEPDNPVHADFLTDLFRAEDTAMRTGEIGSDFAIIVATPRRRNRAAR